MGGLTLRTKCTAVHQIWYLLSLGDNVHMRASVQTPRVEGSLGGCTAASILFPLGGVFKWWLFGAGRAPLLRLPLLQEDR